MNTTNHRLSPSDFAFLYEGCKRCYYNKVARNIEQPSIPLPSIFSKIAALLKQHYDGKRTSELHPALPPGTVRYGEQRVMSQTIKLPNHRDTCYINGRFDIVVAFDDRTYGLIDFKTGSPSDEYSHLYRRQLHAYTYALENSAPGKLKLFPISKMGLLYFHPTGTKQQDDNRLAWVADIRWVEVPRKDLEFHGFINEVLTLLENPEPPDCSPDCRWCAYIEKFKTSLK